MDAIDTGTASDLHAHEGYGDTASLVDAADRERVERHLRIGQISFLNVYPMHWALGVTATQVGTPAELNRAIVAGDLDVACMSAIEYARNADDLMLLPSMCIAAEGAVGSIFAISHSPFEHISQVYATPASATSVALLDLLLRLRGVRATFHTLEGDVSAAIAEPGSCALLIGDDALRARSDASLSGATFTDLGERWNSETGLPMVYAVWAVRRDVAERDPELPLLLDRMLVESVRRFSVTPDAVREAAAAFGMDVHAATNYFDHLCYGFGQHERTGLLRYLRMAHEAGLLDRVPVPSYAGGVSPTSSSQHSTSLAVPTSTSASLTATATDSPVEAEAAHDVIRTMYAHTVGTRAALETKPEDAEHAQRMLDQEEAARDVDVDNVLNAALRDERISEVDAIALLQSGRLVDVGDVAHELRLRRTPADLVTFVVDRNINYTNICVTDCGFCAFYRRPGDQLEGYLHTTETILEKIRETIELGGTAALLQGGHNPDLGIEYYVDLFHAIKQTYPTFHLHALSPPEIQHIARRSKMTIAEVLSTLREAGLDSLPGGGGEVLVDRVRRIIAPKKTKTDEWLGVMREAQRMGMSTTASLMYGHVELLSERIDHMRRIRDLQDEHRGFRAFISWTFQPGNTPLARVLEAGLAPYQEHLPPTPTPFDYLLTQAVSRIYLDNIDNIQSSWVTQGMKVGQAALMYGANDMGSIMIEENVVSSAGTTFRATVNDFVHAITATGMRAVQRDTLYRTVAEHTR
jgi:cyclic dehypoxanthinyl futalosine synthase